MAKEIERKFLCNSLPFELSGVKPDFIQQGILIKDFRHSVRVRIINFEKAYLTYKYKYEINDREEFEFEIPIADGLKMFCLCNPVIFKRRYNIDYNNYHLSFDVFLQNLITCDIEFETKDEADKYTDWHPVFSKEVTEINQYTLLQEHINQRTLKLVGSSNWYEELQKEYNPKLVAISQMNCNNCYKICIDNELCMKSIFVHDGLKHISKQVALPLDNRFICENWQQKL